VKTRSAQLIVGAAILMFALAGCSAPAVSAEGLKPEAGSTAAPKPESTSTTTPKPKCTPVSAKTVYAVNATVVARGNGSSVSDAIALTDERTGRWLVAAGVNPPEGEGWISVWATDGDVTSEWFVGELESIADNTSVHDSTAPVSNTVAVDPLRIPVIGCFDRMMLKKNAMPQ
jgi:hypothetical protein